MHAVGAIVLLGMAAYFSGVVQAPITSFVIIGEMSGADGMVIPLMLAAFIAYGVSRASSASRSITRWRRIFWPT